MSGIETGETAAVPSEAAQRLARFADRIERLMDEIDGLKADLKDVKDEAKADGFNVRAIEKLVKCRRSARALQTESELMSDVALYAASLGIALDAAA